MDQAKGMRESRIQESTAHAHAQPTDSEAIVTDHRESHAAEKAKGAREERIQQSTAHVHAQPTDSEAIVTGHRESHAAETAKAAREERIRESTAQAAEPTDSEAGVHGTREANEIGFEPSKPNKKAAEPEPLPPGVFPFNLPPFAAPFLFVPPYLEPSFRTCSAIYLRHPTITSHFERTGNARRGQRGNLVRVYESDIPSPYPAGGEMFGLAWELYVRNAPRVRSDERRTKLEGRYGRSSGFQSARAFESDRRRVAIRRGWGRKRQIPHASDAPSTSQ